MLDFAAADWGISGIVVVSALISLIRGFIKEAMSLAIWVIAFIIAMNFKEEAAELLVNLVDLPSLRQAAAWILLFVGSLLIGGLVNYLLGKLVQTTGLSGADRLLGLIFGAARGLLIVLALVVMLPQLVPVDQDPWWQNSRLIPEFLRFETWGRETANQVKNYVLGWIE